MGLKKSCVLRALFFQTFTFAHSLVFHHFHDAKTMWIAPEPRGLWIEAAVDHTQGSAANRLATTKCTFPSGNTGLAGREVP
eukprot:SAG11_NODE_114_length_16040_cov_10.050875_10_plen_81_part_00